MEKYCAKLAEKSSRAFFCGVPLCWRELNLSNAILAFWSGHFFCVVPGQHNPNRRLFTGVLLRVRMFDRGTIYDYYLHGRENRAVDLGGLFALTMETMNY